MKTKLTTYLLMALIAANIILGASFWYLYNKDRSGFINEPKILREEKQLESGIKNDPENAQMRILLAKRYLFEGKYDDAIKQFNSALKLEPKNEEALVKIGAAYIQTGETDKALSSFLKEIENVEDKPMAKVNLNLLDAYYYAGKIFLEKNKPAKAKEVLLKAIKMDSKDADSYYYLGKSYLKLGELTKARDASQKAIKLVPDFAQSYVLIGETYYRRGDKKNAKAWAEKALEISPDLREAEDLLGKI